MRSPGHTNVVHETASLVLTYPDVLMATVAVVLLVGVGIVSARAARRRLSYETWHFLHLYTYLAVALAFSHQFATGADFVTNAKARWLWSLLYIAVGALLLWYRLITPIRAAFRHRLRVVQVRRENAEVVTVYIAGRHLDELGTEAGQFFRWRFLTRQLWWAANPYSLSAAPRPRPAAHHRQGRGRPQRRAVRPPTRDPGARRGAVRRVHRVAPPAPQGAAAGRRRRHHPAARPVRNAARPARRRHADLSREHATRISCCATSWTGSRGIAARRCTTCSAPPQPGARDHLSAQPADQAVPDLDERDVFLCGPPPMMAAAQTGLREAGRAPPAHPPRILLLLRRSHMKRVLLAVSGTVLGIVALLSFKTHSPVTTATGALPSAGVSPDDSRVVVDRAHRPTRPRRNGRPRRSRRRPAVPPPATPAWRSRPATASSR